MSVFYAEGMGGGTMIFHVKLLFDRRYQGELSESTEQRNAPPVKPVFYGSH
ncbi:MULTISPECIES: hypothetical protein [Escherichia]|uniref:hypothetical protein n=1 Tax=Escherichia TaxID=561 RepID=UPI000AB35F74|nr:MULTISPECIES: hypothetical protein [Escherichia]MCS1335465.1 hypothetical protein [Escherichia coli]